MRETVILGAGLTGMSTAAHLKKDYELFEKEARPGGLVQTHERGGFRFDLTGHWLHLRDRGIRRMVEKLMPGGMAEIRRDSRIFSKNVYTCYPFQTNTYGLPVETVKEIIHGFIEATISNPPKGKPKNFEEWVLKHMGGGIAKHFMIPYNEKLWLTHPRDMTPLWCQIYVPKPSLDEILDGALRPPKKSIGYNASFLYPKRGGIGALSKALAATLDRNHLHYGLEPKAIHAKKHKLVLSDGRCIGYRRLVSSIPLPELVKLIADAPASVRNAAAKLRWNQVCYFNVAVAKPTGVPAHWVYFPERKFNFYRAGCYSNAAGGMAPRGESSLYVEISHRGGLPGEKALWKRSLKNLVASGFVKREGDVRFYEMRNIPCAYVVFDHNYTPSLKAIRPWLDKYGILSIGRYGRWTYNAMENALIDGREAAKAVRSGP